jgi:bacterioferritin (cytochrome b1)
MSNQQMFFIVSALCCGLLLSSGAMAQPAPVKCGPDHAILYKKAVKVLNSAEKKLAGKYTAEAKAQVKEANSLFSILVKECGPLQKERALTETEMAQEKANNKKKDESYKKGLGLEKSAAENLQKGQQAEAKGQDDLAARYFRQAKAENEQAHASFIQAEIYALKNQEMIFRFLAHQPTP